MIICNKFVNTMIKINVITYYFLKILIAKTIASINRFIIHKKI